MYQAVIFIVCFVIIVIATFIYLIVSLCTSKNTDAAIADLRQSNPFRDSQKWKHIAHWLTILTLSLYSIFSLNASLNELIYSGLNLDDTISCNVMGKISLLIYHTANYLCYCVIISYWHHLYGESEFYNDRPFIKKLHIMIWAFMLIQWGYAIYFDIAFVESHINLDMTTAKHCDDINIYKFPISFGMAQIFFDGILCILFFIIFYVPFRHILHYGVHSAATFDDQTAVAYIPKLFYLVSWMIISHVVIVVCAILVNMAWFIIFDVLINGLCVILMSIGFHSYYETLCKCWVLYIDEKLLTKHMIMKTDDNVLMDDLEDSDTHSLL